MEDAIHAEVKPGPLERIDAGALADASRDQTLFRPLRGLGFRLGGRNPGACAPGYWLPPASRAASSPRSGR